jgi:molybdopterin-dependent oxidoreductase alpha subunit
MERRPGGGWPAVIYTLEKALAVGPWKLWSRMRSRNACKTCALGMGGMKGGMVNEVGHFPEVCKKSLQAQVADMKGSIPANFFEKHSLSDLLEFTSKQAEDAGRLSYPVALEPGATHFQPITWEDAMFTASLVLRTSEPDKVSFYSSGRSSNEAAFLLQSFARVYGTNNVNNCSFYCHQASGVALKMAFGTGTSTVEFEDLAKADLVFLIGANPASNHPRLMTQLANLRGRGGQVIVVNPLRESGLEKFHVPSQVKSLFFGTEIASMYVQPYAGGDVAFLVGILKALIESDRISHEFLQAHVEGVPQALDYAKTIEWSELIRESGVDQTAIEKTAQLLANAKQAIFAWAMGLTHHQWGVDNILALCNVALATGHVGRPGAGLMPIRGHSNVQGVGSIGFNPQLQAAVKEALERSYKTSFPETAGYDTYATMEAAAAGKINALVALGGNLWGSNPDSAWAARSMQKIKACVYLSTKLNPGHFHGRGERTLILPVLARDEEPQATSQESMFNYVRLSEGGAANLPGGMRAESEVICDLANRVLGNEPVDWTRLKDHKEVRRLIAEAIPGWQEIATIDDTKKEFTIDGRIFHTPVFKTASGKAIMHQTTIPETNLKAGSLRLVTLRSEGQFNTVVYEEADIYRGMPHRNCILLSEADAKILKIKHGQRVTVSGEAGSLNHIEVVVGQIRQGVAAMFYPESNVLIKGVIDKRSKTPAFKSAPIWIEPA